jgi:hypothetical protein
MLVLKSNNSIKAQSSLAPNTALSVVVTYNDTGVINVDKGVTTDATTIGNALVDIVSAPVDRINRDIRQISIINTDNQTQTVTIYFSKSATNYKWFIAELLVSEKLEYTPDYGWVTYDAQGVEKSASTSSSTPTTDGYEGKSIGFYKTGTAPDAVGYWYCTSKDSGYPGAFSVGAPGLNGRNTDGTTTTDNGCIPFQNPATGSIYLKSCVLTSTIGHYHRWFDLLWINSGLVVTTTTAQGITTAAFPARDVNGSTQGEGLMIGLLVTTTLGNVAVNNTMTVNYTNSAGTAGRTASLRANVGNQLPATALIGTIVWFNLQGGDKGVRSIQGITLATTLVSGSISLLVARPIQGVPTTIANVGTVVDNGYGIKLYNGTCLLHCYQASSATATVTSGELVFNEK